jgi:cyclic pyranopterin phosphate synthase
LKVLLDGVAVDFEFDENERSIKAVCTVNLTGKTGAEMEALTGVSVSLLTVYDMCKAVDKEMEITDIHLLEKNGGKSGHFINTKGEI